MNEKEVEKILSGLKKRTRPSKELGRIILANLDMVKKQTKENDKGRFSNYELILNQIHIIMTKWKMAVPVILIVLVVAGFIILRSGKDSNLAPGRVGKTDGEYVQIPKEVSVPEALGTIDDVVDAMTAFAENEQVITVEEGNDASMVTIDSQAISDFGQSYNENEF